MTDLLRAELTYYLRGVGFQIQNSLDSGQAEQDYEQALAYLLEVDRSRYKGVVNCSPTMYTLYKGNGTWT